MSWRFCYVIKMMSDAENILDNNECFADTANTPKEGIEQHKKREKRECLKGAISKEKPVVDKNSKHMEGLKKLAIKSVNKVYGQSSQVHRRSGIHILKIRSNFFILLVSLRGANPEN